MQAPLPENEAERLEALRRYRIMDTPPDQQLDDITLLAAHVCEAPTALISLIDADRQWFKSKVGWADRESAREISFCAHGILAPETELVVPDTSRDKRFADNPLVTGDPPHVRFYAGAPLVTEDGHALGMLCVIDRVPRTLRPEQLAALRALRRSVVVELELRRSRAELQRSLETAAGLARDLDERVEQRTNSLRESEERYRKLADSSPDAILIHFEERIAYVNDAMVALMKAGSASELVGKSSTFMLAPEYVDLARQRTRELYAGEAQPRMDQVYVRLDGTLVEVEIASAPLVFDSKAAAHVTARDITHRRRVEAQFKLILDSVPAAISYFDRDETIIAVNRGFEEFVEMRAAEIIGRTVREVIGDEAYALAGPNIERAFAGESVAYERRRVRKDGTPRNLQIQHVPHRDAGGGIVGGFGLTTDVTDIKTVQRALEESGERLRAAAEAANFGIHDRNLRTGAFFISARLKEILGFGPDSPVDHAQAMSRFHPDDRALGIEALARACDPAGDGRIDVEQRIVRGDGEVRWLALHGKVSFEDGKPERSLGFWVDVTDRKRAEESLAMSEARFRAVFERSNAAIAIWGMDGKFIAVNAAFCEFVGYAGDELVGRMTGADLSLPEDSQSEELTGKLMRGEIAFVTRDRGFRRRDASVVWGHASAAVVLAGDGRPQFFVAVVIDVTEARQARERIERINIELEERVQERTAELRSALKELDAFAYSVSHDLRAPAGVVSGFAHLLRTSEGPRLSDDGRHLLAMIENNSERMVNLIEGLLRLSRLGRGQVRRIPLSMTALARDALRMHKSAPDAEIRVGEIPDCDGDPVLLGQVWANLLGNALKYSRTREPARIEIGWDEGRQAYFVRDNGVGFDMKYAGKLFGAFERLHSETEFEGSGIGLAIVQRIVEHHGGAIWADAVRERGATFWFTVK